MGRVGKILIKESEIKSRVKEIAKAISEKYKDKELVVLCVLKGAFVFTADLIREIEGVKIFCDFIKASSYGYSTVSRGVVKIELFPSVSLKGRHVLIVDDILDAGYTLKAIKNEVEKYNPLSCELCVLLDKPERREVEIKVDYIGFRIPDEFVVGYGMDCKEEFRNLKYIAVYEE